MMPAKRKRRISSVLEMLNAGCSSPMRPHVQKLQYVVYTHIIRSHICICIYCLHASVLCCMCFYYHGL